MEVKQLGGMNQTIFHKNLKIGESSFVEKVCYFIEYYIEIGHAKVSTTILSKQELRERALWCYVYFDLFLMHKCYNYSQRIYIRNIFKGYCVTKYVFPAHFNNK